MRTSNLTGVAKTAENAYFQPINRYITEIVKGNGKLAIDTNFNDFE